MNFVLVYVLFVCNHICKSLLFPLIVIFSSLIIVQKGQNMLEMP